MPGGLVLHRHRRSSIADPPRGGKPTNGWFGISSSDQQEGPRPQVYARLAHDAERRLTGHAPPRYARAAGWLLALAIAVTVVAAAVVVQPWG